MVCNSCSQHNDKSQFLIQVDKPLLHISGLSKDIAIQNDSLYFKGQTFTGVLFGLDENTNDTIALERYSNGVLHGISEKRYPNGLLLEKRYYNKGQKNGKQIAYFENGQQKFEFTAQNDQYEGELKEWNLEGTLIHLATYKNGHEEGTQKMWYDNGKIRANYVMMNGRRYGLLGTKNCKNVSDSFSFVR